MFDVKKISCSLGNELRRVLQSLNAQSKIAHVHQRSAIMDVWERKHAAVRSMNRLFHLKYTILFIDGKL